MQDSLRDRPNTWTELRHILDTPNERALQEFEEKVSLRDRPIAEEQLREAMRQMALFLPALRRPKEAPIDYDGIRAKLRTSGIDGGAATHLSTN
jgi:hypothetical protein